MRTCSRARQATHVHIQTKGNLQSAGTKTKQKTTSAAPIFLSFSPFFPLSYLSSHFSSSPASLVVSEAPASLIYPSSPLRLSALHLSRCWVQTSSLSLAAGLVHASLLGLINHPHSWQRVPPPGASGMVFRRRRKTRILSSTFSLAVVPRDQG